MKKIYFLLLLWSLCPMLLMAQYNFSRIDTLLQNNLSTAFNGKVCVMIKRGDSLLYYKSLGGYDSTSVTFIASATKNISAAIILSLAGDNLLRLDDSVGRFLPLFTQTGKGKTTIRQNFSHTGGWADSGNYHERNDLTLAQAADSIATYVPWAYQPGARFSYGGISMHVIGRVAEVAANKSWTQLFNERIRDPLGMTQSAYTLYPINPRIGGGMTSSPRDLMRFAKMLLDGGVYNGQTILKPAYWQEMWRDQTNQASILNSPYPLNPPFNNPYRQPVIYYGFGAWQDIYNPTTRYQEQISGAGAFGTVYWVNRCNNTTGVIFTASSFTNVVSTAFQVMDVARLAIDARNTTCNTPRTDLVEAQSIDFQLSPNPVSDILTLTLPEKTAVTQIQIVDLTGKVWHTQRSDFTQISIRHLPVGMYLLQVKTAQNTAILKFVKS
jgi:CubicO group peptidase (beta-lactamase class C family)